MAADHTQTMLSAQEKEVLATLLESDCARDVAATILQIRSIKNEIVANLMTFLLDQYGATSINIACTDVCTELQHNQQPTKAARSSCCHSETSPLAANSQLILDDANTLFCDQVPHAVGPTSTPASNVLLDAVVSPLRSLSHLAPSPLSSAVDSIACAVKQELPLDGIDDSAGDSWRHTAHWPHVNRPSCNRLPRPADTYAALRASSRMLTCTSRGASSAASRSDQSSACTDGSTFNVLGSSNGCTASSEVSASHSGGFVPPMLWPRGLRRKRPRLTNRTSIGSRRFGRTSHEPGVGGSFSNNATFTKSACLAPRSTSDMLLTKNGASSLLGGVRNLEPHERLNGLEATMRTVPSCPANAADAAPRRLVAGQARELDEKCMMQLSTPMDTIANTTGDPWAMTPAQQLQPFMTVAQPSYACPLCGRSFYDKSNQSRHIKSVHLQLKPYRCTWCTSTFSTNWNLRLHEGRCRARYYVDSSAAGACGATPSGAEPVTVSATVACLQA